ncbi:cytochrome c oxidase assembly protein [Halobacillus sp. A1]|nr:cytochrome c oxidase assembly protein [Halobacillus sp. A1]
MISTSHIHGQTTGAELSEWVQILLALPFIFALILYGAAVFFSRQRQRPWPFYRIVLWVLGIACALVAVGGPLAQLAHMDFTMHMLGHLLLGMLAPLLMALAAPMTLFLRALPQGQAKRLSRFLKSWPSRVLTDPVAASLLNVGGLWILYTTPLYQEMHENSYLHVFIHAHVFIAGYLFTVSMIYIDPTPHRNGYVYRAVTLIAALAGHGILSKYIYGNPPAGVPVDQAESGGMLMYYGGDGIDLVIVFILCLHWYRSTAPENSKVNNMAKPFETDPA